MQIGGDRGSVLPLPPATHYSNALSSVPSDTCALFCVFLHRAKNNSFVFNGVRTLYQEYGGVEASFWKSLPPIEIAWAHFTFGT